MRKTINQNDEYFQKNRLQFLFINWSFVISIHSPNDPVFLPELWTLYNCIRNTSVDFFLFFCFVLLQYKVFSIFKEMWHFPLFDHFPIKLFQFRVLKVYSRHSDKWNLTYFNRITYILPKEFMENTRCLYVANSQESSMLRLWQGSVRNKASVGLSCEYKKLD